MITKERKYKKCATCGHQELISDEEYGCDTCKTEINYLDGNDERDYLEITVHQQGGEAKRYHCCSWACALEKLKTIKTDYFISLPFLMFDTNVKSLGVEGFWAAIKAFK